MPKIVKFSSEYKKLLLDTAKYELSNQEEGHTLSDYYKKCMDQAYMDGVSKHAVSETVLHMLDEQMYLLQKKKEPNIPKEHCKINRTLFFRVSSRLDYRNPEKVRNTTLDSHVNQGNSSIYTGINAEAIHRLRTTKDLCTLAISKFKKCDDISKFFSRKELEELFKQWDAILAMNADTYDEKTKIPANTEQVLLDCLITEASVGLAARKFEKIKLQLKNNIHKMLTRKQTLKFQKSEKASKLWILQPHDRDTAIMLGYLGQQCPKCQSWKTRTDEYDIHTGYCVDCEVRFPIITIAKCPYCFMLLYKEVLLEIVQQHGSKCINVNCRQKIQLPKVLIDYARS